MAGDVAALEASVRDPVVIRLGRKHGFEFRLQRRRTTRAVRGTEVEVRQPAFEQERQAAAADRMPFPQQDAAVLRVQAFEFVAQRVVVGPPVAFDPRGDFFGRRFFARQVDRIAAETHDRAQTRGVLSGIQRDVVGRAVEVDDVARIPRHQHRGAELVRECVQARHVPIGIGHAARGIGHARGEFGRQLGAVVRQADEQRRGAAMQGAGVIHARSLASQPKRPAR